MISAVYSSCPTRAQTTRRDHSRPFSRFSAGGDTRSAADISGVDLRSNCGEAVLALTEAGEGKAKEAVPIMAQVEVSGTPEVTGPDGAVIDRASIFEWIEKYAV
jgi:hypothetical protein